MDEATLHSQLYDVLATSPNGEPMSATEIGKEMRPEMSAADVNRELNKIVTQYSGIGKGYTPGVFKKIGNRWTVATFGMTAGKPGVGPESIIMAVL